MRPSVIDMGERKLDSSGRLQLGRLAVLYLLMSKSKLPVCLLLLSSSMLLCVSARAQGRVPKGDVYLGFTRTGNDTFYSGVGGLNGWEGALHVKLREPFIGIEGDVSHYGLGANSSTPRTTAVMVGPRITLGALGPKVFGHALLGGEHSTNRAGSVSEGAISYALGGGLDVPIAPFFAWRVAGDYIHALGHAPPSGTQARFSTGLVFRF